MMRESLSNLQMSDAELLVEVVQLAAVERNATARLIAVLAEVDARRLYLGQGCSSLFIYCTRVLRLSEHAAYGRIEAARASRRFPMLLAMLEGGELTLTAICLLAPCLNDTNQGELLARARNRSKREVEEIVASVRPRPDVPAMVRKLPERTAMLPVASATGDVAPPPVQVTIAAATTVASPPPVPRVVLEPLAPRRYKLQLTIGTETHDKLRRVCDLMRHSIPSGDIAAVLDRALDVLLNHLERTKVGAAVRPRSGVLANDSSRHIPAAVRRAVWKRDGGRCAFRGAHGPCGETGFLQFHHRQPFAAGGKATEENIELRCRAHDQHEADLFFGEPFIVREDGRASSSAARSGPRT
jgi:hypothetical protein